MNKKKVDGNYDVLYSYSNYESYLLLLLLNLYIRD